VEAKQATWQFSVRAARLESMSTRLWSWVVLGALAAWFFLWLGGRLGHLVRFVPH
jgi:hypothetical protein